jgi:tetratricopeptide (TPR) repeat protein
MEKALSVIDKYLIYIIVVLIPVLSLDIFVNPYNTSKMALLLYTLIALFAVRTVKSFLKGRLTFSAGSFDVPVILLLIAYVLSAFGTSVNKMEAFLLPGSASVILLGAFLYFAIINTPAEEKKSIEKAIVISGIIYSLVVLLATTGILKSIPQLPAYMRDINFSPAGGFFAGIFYLLTILPFAIGSAIQEKAIPLKALWGVGSIIIAFAVVISSFNTNIFKQFRDLPSLGVSWAVTTDSLKEKPLLGVGAGNYLTAFNRFRPVSYNQSDLWRIRFTSGRNFYFTTITETGLMGLAALIIFAFPIYRIIGKGTKEKRLVGWNTVSNHTILSFIVFVLLSFIFPSNVVNVIFLFVLIALITETRGMDLSLFREHSGTNSKGPMFISLLPFMALLIAGGYYGTRLLAGEAVYKDSLDAVIAQDGKKAYDLMRKAITINPYVDRYHASYGQLNLMLANSIGSKKELNDEERNTITQLIQQSIREAKSAVLLNPLRANNWEMLGRIYQSIAPLAKGADEFAAQTYTQAVALDPVNPDLRILLGGVYYSTGNYDNAIRIFELAAATKPNLPNSHYNLAYALKEKGDIEGAIKQMEVVISLVAKDTQDYTTAKQALADFETKKKASETEQKPASDNLTPPPDEQPAAIEPKLDLPEDTEPPAVEEESSPSASPTPLP